MNSYQSNSHYLKVFSVDDLLNIIHFGDAFNPFCQSKAHTFVINPFPNTPFSDRPKFKEAAGDNENVAT